MVSSVFWRVTSCRYFCMGVSHARRRGGGASHLDVGGGAGGGHEAVQGTTRAVGGGEAVEHARVVEVGVTGEGRGDGSGGGGRDEGAPADATSASGVADVEVGIDADVGGRASGEAERRGGRGEQRAARRARGRGRGGGRGVILGVVLGGGLGRGARADETDGTRDRVPNFRDDPTRGAGRVGAPRAGHASGVGDAPTDANIIETSFAETRAVRHFSAAREGVWEAPYPHEKAGGFRPNRLTTTSVLVVVFS